jgi:hypothetical protein
MNRNGIRDFRDSTTQAWRRLGLLGTGEALTQERYARCVRSAAEELGSDGFLSEQSVQRYTEEANTVELPETLRTAGEL